MRLRRQLGRRFRSCPVLLIPWRPQLPPCWARIFVRRSGNLEAVSHFDQSASGILPLESNALDHTSGWTAFGARSFLRYLGGDLAMIW